jgi:hypothetical protein
MIMDLEDFQRIAEEIVKRAKEEHIHLDHHSCDTEHCVESKMKRIVVKVLQETAQAKEI